MFNFNLYTWLRYSLDVVEKFRATIRIRVTPGRLYILTLAPVCLDIVAKLCITVSCKFLSFSSMRNGYAIFVVSRLLIYRVAYEPLYHLFSSVLLFPKLLELIRKIFLELRFHFAPHSSWRELVTAFLSQPMVFASSIFAVFPLLSIRQVDQGTRNRFYFSDPTKWTKELCSGEVQAQRQLKVYCSWIKRVFDAYFDRKSKPL